MTNLESMSIFDSLAREVSARGRWPTPESRDFSELSDPLMMDYHLCLRHMSGKYTNSTSVV